MIEQQPKTIPPRLAYQVCVDLLNVRAAKLEARLSQGGARPGRSPSPTKSQGQAQVASEIRRHISRLASRLAETKFGPGHPGCDAAVFGCLVAYLVDQGNWAKELQAELLDQKGEDLLASVDVLHDIAAVCRTVIEGEKS